MDELTKKKDSKTQELIDEIEAYYGKSVVELIVDLQSEPIVRHFKGGYYRVMSIGMDSTTKNPVVVYKSLNGKSYVWTRDLLEFLSPVPKDKQELNVFGQKRRFEKVKDFSLQLDLVSTKDLIMAISERDTDILCVDKKNIKQKDYVLARKYSMSDGEHYEVVNTFNTYEEAAENLKKNVRKNKWRENCFIIMTRVFYKEC